MEKKKNDLVGDDAHGGREDLGPADRPELPHDDDRGPADYASACDLTPSGYNMTSWMQAALIFGENLSSVGPIGYYDYMPEQWLSWARSQVGSAAPLAALRGEVSDPRLILKAVADLREIGTDCQRGAFGPNLAERLWDIADAISEACEQRPTLRYRYPKVGCASVLTERSESSASLPSEAPKPDVSKR